MTGETPLGAGAAPPGGGPGGIGRRGGAKRPARRPTRSAPAPAPYATLAHRRPERLVQIGNDVVHVLNADGQANQVGAHARGPCSSSVSCWWVVSRGE